MTPTARYQCVHCTHSHDILVRRPVRRFRELWCWRCACLRLFERIEGRLVAETWPPQEREGKA